VAVTSQQMKKVTVNGHEKLNVSITAKNLTVGICQKLSRIG